MLPVQLRLHLLRTNVKVAIAFKHGKFQGSVPQPRRRWVPEMKALSSATEASDYFNERDEESIILYE